MTDFGDATLEDQFCSEGDPDPLPIAERLHELRSALRVLAGLSPLPLWVLYTARAIEVDAMTVALVGLTFGSADSFAERLHEARRMIAEPTLPPWDDLNVEERNVAAFLALSLVQWLIVEGSLR